MATSASNVLAFAKFTGMLALSIGLIGCGSSSSGPPPPVTKTVAAANTTLAASTTTIGALVPAATAPVPVVFNSGFSGVDETGAPVSVGTATTVTFTSAGSATAKPTFSMASGTSTASGTTDFGSCIFTITASTFPAGHPLALGKKLTVDPCTIVLATKDQPADGSTVTVPVTVTFGTATSAQSNVPATISSDGTLKIGASTVGSTPTVTVTVTGAG